MQYFVTFCKTFITFLTFRQNINNRVTSMVSKYTCIKLKLCLSLEVLTSEY